MVEVNLGPRKDKSAPFKFDYDRRDTLPSFEGLPASPFDISSEVLSAYPTDIDLLKAAKNFEEEALAIVFDEHSPRIYKYAYRFCHDKEVADKIVGDTFAVLLEEFAAGRGPKMQLRVHLYKTAHTMVVERTRDNGIPFEVGFDYLNEKLPTTKEEAEKRLLLESLVQAMNKDLTPDQRLVIVLRYFEEFSLKEAAEIVGKEVNNIKVIQNRGIAKLRKALGFNLDLQDEEEN